LHQDVVLQRRLRRRSAPHRWRDPTAATMALPGLQPPQGRAAAGLHLLVRKGARAARARGRTAAFLRTNVWEGAGEEVPAPVREDVSCGALSAVRAYECAGDVLLWEA
ncbi:hypothetical protein LTR53_019252, partial [Teratosphaeriaceae sp. CCFEE 6253]